MQVLYYSPVIWSNTDFYRTTGVLPFINHPDIFMRDISHYGRLTQWDLESGNVLIIQRPCNPDHLRLLKLAKKLGLKVIVDHDDDLLNVDQFNPAYSQYTQQRDFILECILLADEVWVTTQSVQESFGRGIVIPNALNDYLLDPIADFNSESNRVFWRGGHSHQADMYEKADEIVAIVNGHPELDFFFIGDRFTYLEQRCGNNFNSVGIMPLTQYFDYLKQLKPRAMIFPLCDTMLNRGKSNISFLEATWAGAAYFGNVDLPEFHIKQVLPLNLFDKYIGSKEILSNTHESSNSYIHDGFFLSTINKKRIESLLTLAK